MRITILNGEPDAGSAFAGYVDRLAARLGEHGDDVTALTLRDMDLHGCTGCFGCWIRTPGECVQHDDGAVLCRAAINADLLVLAGPVLMGYPSALLKRAFERMIPLLSPYMEIEGGELHHRKRYASYPEVALLLAPDESTDAEDLAITRDLIGRMARNFKSRLAVTLVADRSEVEVADELVAAS